MDNVTDFPTADKSTENLTAIQPAAARTRTVEVTTRIVAKQDGMDVEIERVEGVFVRPLVFRKWLTALGFVREVMHHIPEGNFDLKSPEHLALWMTELLGSSPDQVIGLASLATEKPTEFFDQIDLDDGIKIIVAVVEVNKDFFIQKVLPMIEKLAPGIQGKMTEIAETFGQTE